MKRFSFGDFFFGVALYTFTESLGKCFGICAVSKFCSYSCALVFCFTNHSMNLIYIVIYLQT